MPRSVFITTSALVALAAVLGLIAGQRVAILDESDVVRAMVQRYVHETGHPATDCTARPGQGRAWVRVNCGRRIYEVDRRGLLLPPRQPET